jgi:hypothetical protein
MATSPARLSSSLRKIVAGIDAARRPDRARVAHALRAVLAGIDPVNDALATATGCSAYTMRQLFPEFVAELAGAEHDPDDSVTFSVGDFNSWFDKNYGDGSGEPVMDYGGGDLHNMYDYLRYVKSPLRVEELASDEFIVNGA